MGKRETDRLKPSQYLQNMTSPITLYMSNGTDCDEDEKQTVLPSSCEFLDNQVAGHRCDDKNLGMIKSNGNVLKPCLKNENFNRELCFYKQINVTCNLALKEMKDFVPEFYGCESLSIDDKCIECLVLEDLTKGYKEPCIMDIKIGKRTWDPLANYDKIIKEEEKFYETKRDLGFSIPGFQVYKVTNGQLRKFDKEYGKVLNKDTVVDALKVFLNADTAWNRNLLVQLLVNLWRIQKWARKQTSLRLYSSSILLIYDARRLRQMMQINGTIRPVKSKPALRRTNSLYRPLSLAVLNDNEGFKSGFSGQLNKDGPIFPTANSTRIIERAMAPPKDKKGVTTLKRMHSFQNNYDKDLQNIKSNYVYMLDDLVSDDRPELWATVKMIDFAHTFPAETNNVDNNYLDGIESLVKIFEGFLLETDARN